MARPDFRGTAARRLSEERELSPSIISFLSPEGSSRATSIRNVPLERIEANPEQPRLSFDEATLAELSASVREHGVLQPVLVRPLPGGRYQLIAGERRWRAAKMAGLATVPAMIEIIDDDTALEIAIIENLQREDLSPLDEALMYERMTQEHGYSVRKLAQKLGKDKGYIENRLRLADAPAEIKQLVSLRKDTLSHAYELLKIEDPRKRRRLSEQVARGELSLVKLREKIEGRRPRVTDNEERPRAAAHADGAEEIEASAAWTGVRHPVPLGEDSLINAKGRLAEALDELVGVLRSPAALSDIGEVDRSNLAKYLTIVKLKLENAIALVRSGSADRES
ncbi:MAG: chromosome partitioning protein ParB, chromosome partitioning protein, ParB family [Chloroflexi bacterium CSP1-4]|nr:MAG: chromosome partitioning protein ParB, chromosome partitioning protein, ParB family [Chloroflexi bacterium CSP1-4]